MNILFFLKPKAEVAFVYDYHTLRQAMEIMEKKLRFFFSLFGVSDIILSSLRHVVFNRFSVGNAVSKSKGRENFVSIYNMAVDVI